MAGISFLPTAAMKVHVLGVNAHEKDPFSTIGMPRTKDSVCRVKWIYRVK